MSISEPYVLSSYGVPQLTKKQKQTSGANPYLGAIVSQWQNSSKRSSKEYATVTVSMNGVHILDLSTLHPVISHTLGPSVTFSSLAVSRHTVEDGAHICTTFAAIELAPDIPVDERGRTIWAWRGNLSSTLGISSQEKRSVTVPHPISQMYAPDDVPSSLLLLSPNADITSLDTSSFAVLSSRIRQENSCKLIRSFIFTRNDCTFMPPRPGAVVILLYATGDETYVEVLAIDEEEGTVDLGKCLITIESEKICDVTCSTSGYITILTSTRLWNSYQLSCDSSVSLEQLIPSLQLKSLQVAHDKCSLLSLNTSHVLLASSTTAKPPSVTILVWDLQYGTVLAEHAIPVPAALPNDKIRMNLVHATITSALLTLSPSSSRNTDNRLTILVIPFTVPPTSMLAHVLGKGGNDSLASHWLGRSSDNGMDSRQLPKSQNRFLQAISIAHSTKDYSDAKIAWDKVWWSQELDEFKVFVEKTLEVVLPKHEEGNELSGQILDFLLEKGLLKRGSINGGLLQNVAKAERWDDLDKVMRGVFDLSEDDIMEVLLLAIKHSRTTCDPAAMQVDHSTSTSDQPLSTYLASCILYPASPPPLRLAIRKHLQDPEHLLCILTLVEGWIRTWANADVKLLPPKQVGSNEFGVKIWMESEMEEHLKKIPPYHKVLTFLQNIMDAQWLTLLSYSPSHSILRTLLAHLEPQISSIDTVEALRGPLEPFARTHGRMLREGREGKKVNDEVDWRKRWREKENKIQGAIGVYRLEELVL